MFFWQWPTGGNRFKVNDTIRYRPDPYSWESNEQIGVIEEVMPQLYRVKWGDGSTDVLDKGALEAACELVDTHATMGCYHDWRDYNGFTKIYQYCSKCDEKRNKA